MKRDFEGAVFVGSEAFVIGPHSVMVDLMAIADTESIPHVCDIKLTRSIYWLQ